MILIETYYEHIWRALHNVTPCRYKKNRFEILLRAISKISLKVLQNRAKAEIRLRF